MVNDKVIIYVKKDNLHDIDFTNIEILESYFQELLKRLKDYYDIKIVGFYNIKVYIDDIYGIVLELENENIDYGDYYDQVEMRIIPIYTNFLYKVNDILNIKDSNIYLYKNDIYLKLSKNILLKDYYLVMDQAKIVYNNTDNIIKYGKPLKRFNFNNFML